MLAPAKLAANSVLSMPGLRPSAAVDGHHPYPIAPHDFAAGADNLTPTGYRVVDIWSSRTCTTRSGTSSA